MPDITMCTNKHCPLKDDCYRFTATPNKEKQSYSWFPYNKIRNKCDYFLNKNKFKYDAKKV